jgi:hypothetical protein
MARVFNEKTTGSTSTMPTAAVIRILIGPSRPIAEQVLADMLGSIARRQHLGVIEDSKISFADFTDMWWKRIAHTLKPRT